MGAAVPRVFAVSGVATTALAWLAHGPPVIVTSTVPTPVLTALRFWPALTPAVVEFSAINPHAPTACGPVGPAGPAGPAGPRWFQVSENWPRPQRREISSSCVRRTTQP